MFKFLDYKLKDLSDPQASVYTQYLIILVFGEQYFVEKARAATAGRGGGGSAEVHVGPTLAHLFGPSERNKIKILLRF